MNKHLYLEAMQVAGYSGWVIYGDLDSPSHSYWMIPGTFEYDWDNR